jgi:hypothetical protein
MKLDEAQRKQVVDWIGEGLKLSEIQNRLVSELGLKMTYMEVRMLVDDLKVMPKDPTPPPPPPPTPTSTLVSPAANSIPDPAPEPVPAPAIPAPGSSVAGRVAVSIDQITRPGAMVSGRVTFSDGKGADWYLDQTGRLGLIPKQAGYRPPAADVQQFQAALEAELSKMGM